ncbi:hypothetical protein Tco_0565216 [Tanacetum coccineum]
MASFDYRLNPIRAIKECSSCGALYTADFCCSKEGLEDKILVPIPESFQRPIIIEKICFDCGDLVRGLYCRECALIRKTLEEVFQNLQDTSRSSDDNTNVLMLLESQSLSNRTPSCGKGAHYGYNCPPKVPIISNPELPNNQTVDELPQSVQQQCLFRTCQQCGCNEYDGVCFYCKVGNGTPINVSTPYSSNDSPSVANHPPQSQYVPYSCELCGNDSHYEERAANLNTQPPQETSVEILQDRENIINSVQIFLRKFNRYSFFETPKVLLLAWDKVFEIKDAIGNKHYKPEGILELFRKLHDDVKNIHEELAEYINTPGWNRPNVYYDDDDEDYTIAITPLLSTEEPDNSLSMGDEHLDTVLATESDEVIKSSVEDLVPIPSESEGIPDKMCDVPFRDNSPPLDILKDQFEGFSDSNDDSTSINDDSFSIDDIDYVEASPPDSELVSLKEVKDFHTKDGEIEDDILREKLSKINLLIAKIEALNTNPPLSFDFVTKSPSTFPNSFLEETNTFDNSIPESETFCFDLEEKSSGNPTSRSDYSLPDYEAFYLNYDHIEEKSSGSTTTHADFSQYDSFIFDLSINPFPPAGRSDFYHEEFADELAHIISPPEYDCFYFKNEPELGDFTMDVVGDIFPTREPRVHVPNVLPTHPTLNLDLDFILSSDSLFAYVDCPDSEASRARGFCPSITRASYPQLHFGNPIS